MILPNHIFKGSLKNPFLAPRGIFVCDTITAVCDTAHNRVFIWTSKIETAYQEPNIILGEKIETGICNARTFQYPSGLWTDGQKLIVADAWNHRVLIWHTFPVANFQEADVVIGQQNFVANLPNAQGVNTPCNEQTLYWCYGVFSDGKALWIADTGNRRILFFDDIPTENFAKASKVIGQPNFETKDLNPNYSTWPYSIKISNKGEMLVTDTQYFRVLYWQYWQASIDKTADLILGQNDLISNGQNQFRMKPNAQTLNWNYDAIFDNKGGIYVADTGNSRVLYWSKIPTKNNSEAEKVLGQQNFEMLGENKESIMGENNYLYWPFSISYADGALWVCETGNNRMYQYYL